VQTVVEIEGDPTMLPAGVEVAVYRIVDEALTNIVRHAQADTCTVHVGIDADLRVQVVDDGCGLPHVRRYGVRITSMRERAEELGGRFSIDSALPRGTLIEVHLPLPRRSA
jgi:signal transduction histidine kinase